MINHSSQIPITYSITSSNGRDMVKVHCYRCHIKALTYTWNNFLDDFSEYQLTRDRCIEILCCGCQMELKMRGYKLVQTQDVCKGYYQYKDFPMIKLNTGWVNNVTWK